jgi:hypothetical protein
MNAFFVRWRSARQFREYEVFADVAIGARLLGALEATGGMEIWQAGTLWKCPGCGDRTIRTEEFLEGLRRAEVTLQEEEEQAFRREIAIDVQRRDVLEWLAAVAGKMLGCERDRVYIKDAGADCTFAGETYTSRI